MRVFEEEGVEPRKVQIAHTGDSDDLDYTRSSCGRGVTAAQDPSKVSVPVRFRSPALVRLFGRCAE